MVIETKKNFCGRCEFETNHIPLHKEMIDGDNDDYLYQKKYFIVKCCGCDKISFREEFIDLEQSFPDEYDNWHPLITISNYPNRTKVKSKLNDYYILPDKIKRVYEESIKAFSSECFLLTGVAFRAIIEAICIDKNITGRDLAKKIDNLVTKKLITEKEAQRLHSIRFVGNDSVHEMTVPAKEKLLIVLNIIEHLLNNLYIIDFQSGDHLEKIVSKFNEFEDLLNTSLLNFERNDEIPLAKLLGKDFRRLNGKISDFETELKTKIMSGEYINLEIGKIDSYGDNSKQIQHFKIVK